MSSRSCLASATESDLRLASASMRPATPRAASAVEWPSKAPLRAKLAKRISAAIESTAALNLRRRRYFFTLVAK